MAIVDYSEAFSQAWRPLDTLMRGRLALAEHDMTRREREADEAERRRFLLELDEKRDTRQRSHDAAMTNRQLAAIKAQNDEMFSRQEKAALEALKRKAKGLGLAVAPDDDAGSLEYKINQHEEGRGGRDYQALRRQIEANNKTAFGILSQMDEGKQRAIASDILPRITEHLTDAQRLRLQAFANPKAGLKYSSGESVRPASPQEIEAELSQDTRGGPGNPKTRRSAYQAAYTSALEKVSGKNDPNILELQSLAKENERLTLAAAQVLASPGVASSLPNAPEPKVETPQSDPAKAFLNLKPKASEGPVSPAKSEAAPDMSKSFGEETLGMWGGRLKKAADVLSVPGTLAALPDVTFNRAVGAVTAPARRVIGSVLAPGDQARMNASVLGERTPAASAWHAFSDQPSIRTQNELVPYFERQIPPAPELTRPVKLSPEDEQALGVMVHQELGPDMLKEFLARVQAHDPAALRQARDYRDRYLQMKTQAAFGASAPTGIDEGAIDAAAAYR